VFVRLCTVTDFSADDKAGSVNFCSMVHPRPGQEISQFGELCCPRSFPTSPKSDESVASPALGSHGADDAGVRTDHAQDRHVWIYSRPRRLVLTSSVNGDYRVRDTTTEISVVLHKFVVAK